MQDRAAYVRNTFVRPVAHRGLHRSADGIIENTIPAFKAAIANGYAIECDVRPGRDGQPIVFHDLTWDRLTDARGAVALATLTQLSAIRFRGSTTVGIPLLSDLFDLVAGRVPLLVEIKSEWTPPDMCFLQQVADLSQAYDGPVALMSFDPDVIAVCRRLAPSVPRGIVSGRYRGAGWWNQHISRQRGLALSNLELSAAAAPDFYAYDVKALPTPATVHARHVQNMPLFTWTVRTAKDQMIAAAHADAIIFEGFKP